MSDRKLEPMCDEEGEAMALERRCARDALEEGIARLHREAQDLQALLDALPAKPPPEAERALWNLVARSRLV